MHDLGNRLNKFYFSPDDYSFSRAVVNLAIFLFIFVSSILSVDVSASKERFAFLQTYCRFDKMNAVTSGHFIRSNFTPEIYLASACSGECSLISIRSPRYLIMFYS